VRRGPGGGEMALAATFAPALSRWETCRTAREWRCEIASTVGEGERVTCFRNPGRARGSESQI